MIGNHSRSSKRSAFTLVELLVVILIIAILVSLISSAVMTAMRKIPEVQTRTEITQLETALRAFMSDYNISEPPPSKLILYENINLYGSSSVPGAAQSYQWLQKAFSKNLGNPINPVIGFPWVDWNGDNQPDGPGGNVANPWVLEGDFCLTFYLGGIPNTAAMAGGAPPGPQGFSTNNMNPATPGGKRKGPYFNFVTSRLLGVGAVGGFFLYYDPWQVKASNNYGVGPRPYVYFSCYGINNGYNIYDCSNTTLYTDPSGQQHFAMPYWTGPNQFTNSNTYQIISAGRDGMFGYNPAFPQPNNLWSPTAGAPGTGADDQSNFSSTLLGVGQN